MIARAIPFAHLASALRARMKGPGGYYNMAVIEYFAGSHGTVALTLATLVFFWGGEAYHRAWARPDAPDPALNRVGDFCQA